MSIKDFSNLSPEDKQKALKEVNNKRSSLNIEEKLRGFDPLHLEHRLPELDDTGMFEKSKLPRPQQPISKQ